MDAPGGRGPVRYNPAGLALPSPVQGHATVMAGILVAIALLFVGAWFVLRGVGPFTSTVVSTSGLPGGTGVAVQVQVTNQGERAGQARCQAIATAADGILHRSQVRLSPRAEPGETVTLTLRVDGLAHARDLQVRCS